MSKVVQAIAATRGDKVRSVRQKFSPLFTDVFSVKEDIQSISSDLEIQYSISATIGAKVWISESERTQNDGAIEYAINRTKRQVIEAIFGEFRQDIRMLERLIYDRDMEGAGKALYELERKMFEME